MGLENSASIASARRGTFAVDMCVSAAGTNFPLLIVVRRGRYVTAGYGRAVADLILACIPAVGCRLICMISSLVFCSLG